MYTLTLEGCVNLAPVLYVMILGLRGIILAKNYLLFYFNPGCKLQVTIQNQDERGRYHVLLMADSGPSQVKSLIQ